MSRLHLIEWREFEMNVYVEIHESRLYSVTLRAPSIEEAQQRAEQLHRDHELDGAVIATETVAVEHPAERAGEENYAVSLR